MNEMLEFQQIKEMLKAYAMTEKARERLEALKPYLDQTRAEAAVQVKPRREDEFWMLLEILPFQKPRAYGKQYRRHRRASCSIRISWRKSVNLQLCPYAL